MATEEGIVIKLEGDTASVRATKTEACEGCSAQSSCHAMGGGKEMEINAINDVAAQVGDRVLLSFDTPSLLKATFLLYIVPVIALILGAGVGQTLSKPLDLDPSVGSCLLAFSFFAIAAVFVKSKGNAMGERGDFQPRITRILDRQAREKDRIASEILGPAK